MTTTRSVTHETTIAVPAKEIYRLLADVENWPVLFGPTVHVECLERAAGSERVQIWATANGSAKTWTSRRDLDPAAGRIDFRQEKSAHPVGAMAGAWVVEELDARTSRVRLLHDYSAATGDPADLAWIDEAVDRNSTEELAALKATLEEDDARPDLLLDFEDSVRIDGAVADVYAFLDEADRWPERLQHVARVALTEDVPGLQVLEMDTRTKDGAVHTTKSVRVCQSPTTIHYKQVRLPALMTLHTGRWHIADHPDGGLAVSSRHTVRLNEANIGRVLGADADVEAARTYVRNALSGNSLATLRLAKSFAENR